MNRETLKTRNSWRAMRQRCLNKNHKYYSAYGGVGIAVCKTWTSFSEFLKDMGIRPENTSLDRVDNEGNYEKDNCRWATRKQQIRNSTHLRLISFNGKTMCMRDWADEIGIDERTLYARLSVYGWSLHRALQK